MPRRNNRKKQLYDIGAPVVTGAGLPPELEEPPVPDELTGRASKTIEDLAALFGSENDEHLQDGFRGGSGDEPEAGGPPRDRDAAEEV